ncbi:MAG: molybdate ABC transporter substrate-binding protein [Beijerinckiaceae bacterium]|nr:molybdate ABC transporter substrate-binding protein [Beijerinckiaceae bacterium]
MKTALDAVAAAWKAGTGKTVKISYASSATLAKQIAQGAPADIFFSADLKWMDFLENDKLIRSETLTSRFCNKPVLVEPGGYDTKVEIAKDFDVAAPRVTAKSRSARSIHAQPEFMPRKRSNFSECSRASSQISRKRVAAAKQPRKDAWGTGLLRRPDPQKDGRGIRGHPRDSAYCASFPRNPAHLNAAWRMAPCKFSAPIGPNCFT